AVTCDDDLRDGAHADDVGADPPEEPVLGTGLQVRSGHSNVDAPVNLQLQVEGGILGDLQQFIAVGLRHVGEAGAKLVVVRSDQRVVPDQVDVVVHQH